MAQPENELEQAARSAIEKAEQNAKELTNPNEVPEIHTVELPANDPNSDRTETPKPKRKKRTPKD